MTELIYLPHTKLKLHPDNIRRYYPPADVDRMAESIRAAGGVIQALLIYPDGDGMYFVADGNMRLAGARALGDECPLLKCEVIEASRFEQLILMTITTEFHFPKDPISQGLHYQRLIEQEHLSVSDIAAKTGLSRATIEKALKVLELEPEIQEYIATGKLSPDLQVSRALLSIPSSSLRLKLARRFVQQQSGIGQIVRQCAYVLRQAARLPATENEAKKTLETQAQMTARAAKALNTKIALKEHPRFDGDAAKMIYDAATKILCENCRLDGLSEECYLCPGPKEFIDHLIEMCECKITE
jgi:ParB/RepB/Spo0J family partition protein